VDVLEVKGIGSVFGDILHVAVDIVDGLAPVGIVFAELLAVDHLEVRFHSGVNVYPNVNEAIDLFDMILPKSRVFRSFLPKGRPAFLRSKTLFVLDRVHHQRLLVVI
jgi:hypothetical protein